MPQQKGHRPAQSGVSRAQKFGFIHRTSWQVTAPYPPYCGEQRHWRCNFLILGQFRDPAHTEQVTLAEIAVFISQQGGQQPYPGGGRKDTKASVSCSKMPLLSCPNHEWLRAQHVHKTFRTAPCERVSNLLHLDEG
jgi:hypothetical protein